MAAQIRSQNSLGGKFQENHLERLEFMGVWLLAIERYLPFRRLTNPSFSWNIPGKASEKSA